jgi:hypothetical protein
MALGGVRPPVAGHRISEPLSLDGSVEFECHSVQDDEPLEPVDFTSATRSADARVGAGTLYGQEAYLAPFTTVQSTHSVEHQEWHVRNNTSGHGCRTGVYSPVHKWLV